MTSARSMEYVLLRVCERWGMRSEELVSLSRRDQERLVAYEMVRGVEEALGARRCVSGARTFLSVWQRVEKYTDRNVRAPRRMSAAAADLRGM